MAASHAHATAAPGTVSSPATAEPATAPKPDADALGTWMRQVVSAAFISGDLDAIAGTFDQMARSTLSGYPNWHSIARDGSQAARAGSIEGAKAACRACHIQYESAYRARSAPAPVP
jgi:hypothetical protein